MPEIIACDEHVQLYDVWRERGNRDLAVAHIDFHCDMRGLLIDRKRACAYMIDAGDYRVSKADSGNFLAHAVVTGVVRSVVWIHDPYGGRRYDIGTVKYESDLTAIPHRVLHHLKKGTEFPLDFAEVTFDDWAGPRPGEQLDIDWDGIASIDYELPHIRKLMRGMLERDYSTIPETTFLVYSPGYSNPDRELYEEFLAGLAGRFGAEVKRLPAPVEEPPRSGGTRLAEAVEKAAVLALHRVGIY